MGIIVNTLGERNLQAQIISLVNSSKHLKAKRHQLKTTSGREGSRFHLVLGDGRYPDSDSRGKRGTGHHRPHCAQTDKRVFCTDDWEVNLATYRED